MKCTLKNMSGMQLTILMNSFSLVLLANTYILSRPSLLVVCTIKYNVYNIKVYIKIYTQQVGSCKSKEMAENGS